MKKYIFLITLLISACFVSAQKSLNVFKTNDTSVNLPTASIDSVKFDQDETTLEIYQQQSQVNIPLSDIDSVNFKNVTIISTEYKNPVYKHDFPDPAIIRTKNNVFYAYATNGGYLGGGFANVRTLKSTDLVNWVECADPLPRKPKWADQTSDYWAPHVIYANEKYYLYFSARHNNRIGMGIGVAVSKYPDGPFTAMDEPIIYGESFEHIDPMVYIDPISGNAFMYWGSASKPIRVQQLEDDLLTLKKGSSPKNIIFTSTKEYEGLVEGPWLTFKDGYYYMFHSGENCCGQNARYATLVARSKSLTGPFKKLSIDIGGDSNAILVANSRFHAPGHNSIIKDDNNDYWILYHAIDLLKGKGGREFLIDKLKWDENGWPKKMTPSTVQKAGPIIKIYK